MELRLLGRTGIQVSPICFGTMSFGGDADEATSADLYRTVREAGINFLDCADAYQKGEAERILGRLMAHERDNLVITTKCHYNDGTDVNAGGLNRRHMVRAVERSLKNLGTDRVEVYFMHHWDPKTPMEEILRACEDLIRSGKVLHLGLSNWAAWQIATALGTQRLQGWSRVDVLQPMYSLVKRQVEVEILPLARAENLGVMTYSPIGAGLLSGKYRGGAAPEGRLTQNHRYAKRYSLDQMTATAEAFTAHADAAGVHPVTLAVAWVMGNPVVTCPIIGARSVEQLRPALAALDHDLTPEARGEITALSPAPPPATDRLEETL
ncbi:MAG: aldo/keto reductase [Pseudomonadota bacterium]